MQRPHVLAVEPDALGQHQPALDAALVVAAAVVLLEARAPLAAQRRVLGARHQGGVLDRDAGLVIEAVEHPGLYLPAVALAAVQQPVERVQAVVALGADALQRRFELLRRQQPLRLRVRFPQRRHSSISMPS